LIGSTGTSRWPQTPDVPTFAESGFPDLVGFIVWDLPRRGRHARQHCEIFNEATNKALRLERVKRIMVDNAYFVTGGTPDALWSVFNKQIWNSARWSGAVRSSSNSRR